MSQTGGKKIIVISPCLSRVVTAERWLLRLFVVSAALSKREEEIWIQETRGERQEEENDRDKLPKEKGLNHWEKKREKKTG